MKFYSWLLIFALTTGTQGVCLAAKEPLTEAWAHYLRGDYQKAIDTCRAVSKEKMLGDAGHYIMGLAFLKLNKTQDARDNFEFVLQNYPNAAKTQETLLGMADAYFLDGAWGSAEQYYLKLLNDFPKTDYASIAYLRLGESQRNLGKWQESESSFKRIVADFPSSLECEAAKRYLEKEQDSFSIQVGAFSTQRGAQNFCRVLIQKGHDAYVEKTYKDDRLIYRVRVGKFSTQEQAESKASELKKQGFSTRICH